MKEVMKVFLTFAVFFWLIVLHYIIFYLIDVNVKASIMLGILVSHTDMFLIASFFVGYNKQQQEVEEESK